MEHKELRDAWQEDWMPSLKGLMRLNAWQELGVSFLHTCHKTHGFAMLADEMGVGKVSPFRWSYLLLDYTIFGVSLGMYQSNQSRSSRSTMEQDYDYGILVSPDALSLIF